MRLFSCEGTGLEDLGGTWVGVVGLAPVSVEVEDGRCWEFIVEELDCFNPCWSVDTWPECNW